MTTSASDIWLDGEPYQLYRPKSRSRGQNLDGASFDWGYGAADAASRIETHDVLKLWSDWSGGMGLALDRGDPSLQGMYHYGLNVCTRWPNVVTPGPLVTQVSLPGSVSVAPRCAFEMGGHQYVCCGRYVLKIANGTGPPTIFQDLGASFTAESAWVFANGKAYIGGLVAGAPGHIWEFNGTAWAQSVDVTGRFVTGVYWVAGGVGANRLVVTDTLISFKYTAVASPNPLSDADYSSSITVDAAYPIQSVTRTPERVFFPCKNGLHDVFSDQDGNIRSINKTSYWGDQLDDANGAYSIASRNHVYATFAGGIDRIDVTNQQRLDGPQWADVGAYFANETPIYGTGPFALDRGWLVSMPFNGIDSHLMYGGERSELNRNGPGPLAWHGSEATREGHQSTLLHQASPGGNPRLWIGSSEGGIPRLAWASLPKASSPLQDYLLNGPMRFAPLGQLFQAAYPWENASATKIISWLTMQTRNLGGGALIDIYANAEGGAYAGQGTARRSPRTKISPRAPAVTGHTIGLMTTFKSGATVPAILEELGAYVEVNAELTKQIKLPIVVARRTATRSPADEYRIPANLRRKLEALQTRGDPIEHRNVFGETMTVNVQPGMGGETIEDEDGGWTDIASVTLTVLSQARGRTLHYGVSENWGDGYVYGSGAVSGQVFRWGGFGSRYSRGYVYAAA